MSHTTRSLRDMGAGILAAASARARTFLVVARPRLPIVLPALFLLLVLSLAGAVSKPVAAALVAALAGGFAVAVAREELSAGVKAVRRMEDAFGRSLRDGDWRSLVEVLPDAAMVLDDDGRVLHFNPAAVELFPSLKAGQPLSRVSRHPELMGSIDRAVTVGEPAVVLLIERIPVERRTSATVTRFARRSGARAEQPTLLITFRDLSEQDKLAQMREDFIANASHELRTPLASLKGFLETLQGPARDDAKARERFLGLMASQAERMSRLIDDLLSLSRVEMRAHLPPRGIVDLNEVASYAIQTLEPQAVAAGAEVVLVPHDVPARIRGDRDEIVQVILNLVQNAIIYGGDKGRIEVRVARLNSGLGRVPRVSVAVSDRGPGIAPEHLPRLTERFYRANAATSRAKGGTGLGLAIVKHIVARHRGDLDVVSRLGQGSTFTVAFDELVSAAETRR